MRNKNMNKTNMTNEELKKYQIPREVRVVANTKMPSSGGMNNLIGKEFKVKVWDFDHGTVSIWSNDSKSTFWYFNISDVAILTPMSYEGKRIAIGDEVKWHGGWRSVTNFRWTLNKWRVDTIKMNHLSGSTILDLTELEGHRTHQEPTITLESILAKIVKMGNGLSNEEKAFIKDKFK